MEKKISNFSIIFYTVTFIIIGVFGYSYYKVIESRHEKMIYSMEENIKFFAKRCVLEKKCKKEMILKDLYDNSYMEEIVNPVTKEIINSKTKITYSKDKIEIEYIDSKK